LRSFAQFGCQLFDTVHDRLAPEPFACSSAR
jgi:hypothetical protein